ncbi:HlyD family efflux transporter periplasmic adaptor subunit, partial [Terasakiella sp.]|uniref:HlyD family efflux transporter periplasmic adaptor subunit n=1 Tax=Terasakiella sp. TaxID=2034861 RepID=UPI003AA7EFA3
MIAPVSGKIQQLAIHTVGGVVTPAQELLSIVPADSGLEIEVKVLNKDIGFVHEKQDVEIKVDSFPFTKYGTIEGDVLSLSRDSIEDEQQGLVYPARISMSKTEIQSGDKMVD